MKKSKHYRKDVIMARIVFAVFCISIVVLLVIAGMEIVKRFKPQDTPNTQNSQNENSQNIFPEPSEPDTNGTEIGSEITGETQPESESEPDEAEIYGKTTVGLNLREEPNTSCEVILTIPEGGSVLIIEDLENGWYRVSYNGNEGYVNARYIRIAEE